MIDLATIREFVRYGDWANGQVIECAGAVNDDLLDRPMEVGPGTLRRTLLHIWAGEMVWLARWRGEAETRWPDERERANVEEIGRRLDEVGAQRARFLDGLGAGSTAREQPYRDSKGGLFRATLGEMLVQGVVHSIHHRAQAVNLLRRLGVPAPEVDYMMWVRRPAP